MAIQLPGTPQQQKASFSAFDTSSNFKSGLTDVGQALRDVGAGQRRMKERQELEAERDRRDAEVAQNELDRKEKSSQGMLGQESELVYGEKLGNIEVAINEAFNTGNFTAINENIKQLKALDPKSQSFSINDHLPQNHRSEIDNEEVKRRSILNYQKAWNRLNTSIRVKRVTSETSSRTLTYLDKNTQATVNFLDKYRDEGAPNEALTASVYEIIEDPMHLPIREATSLGTPRGSFDGSLKQMVLDRLMNQFENTGVLSKDEVDSRMEAIRDIITDKRLLDAGIVFDGADEEAISNAYNKKRTEIINPEYQKEKITLGLSNINSQLAGIMNLDILKPENLNSVVKEISTLRSFDESSFSPTQVAKLESVARLAAMFMPDVVDVEAAQAGLASASTADERAYFQSQLNAQDEPALAYQLFQYMAKLPEARGTTVATALKDFFGPDFAQLLPSATEQSMLSDWINKNLKAVRNVGDNPRALGRLSPRHADLVKRAAQGDKSSRYEVEKLYKDFVSTHPDLASVAAPDFYVTQQETATSTIGDITTFRQAIETNVDLNGAKNTLSHAAFKLNQGDNTPLEVLRYRAEQVFAETLFSSGGDRKQASSVMSTLVTNYKSGLEADTITDGLYSAIVIQNSKFDIDQEGERISLIALASVHENSSEASRVEYYNTMLKGYINKHKDHLIKLDDPEKQHKFIRDEVFKDNNVFPHVAALGNGGLVEIPVELNKYINPKKDRAGVLARAVDPAIALFSDQESTENVGTVYSTAAMLEFFEQNPSLNIDQILREIEKSVSPKVHESIGLIRKDYSGLSGSRAMPVPLDSTDVKAVKKRFADLRTKRALIKGLTQSTIDGSPLLKISTVVQQNEAGFLQKVAVMNVINSDGIYEPLARSDEDRRPITASIPKLTAIVDNVMPRITSFLKGAGDDTGNVDAELFGSYVPQLLGAERPLLSRLTHKVHEQTYNKEQQQENRLVPIWQY